MGIINKNDGEGFLKGVFMAYFILIFHFFLFAGLGFLVLFFRGIIHYMLWIFLAGSAVLFISGYRFYKQMKREGRSLREILNSTPFRGQAVEVSLLGGLATFKVGKPEFGPNAIPLEAQMASPMFQIEDPATIRLRKLNDLARLYDKGLITKEEFSQTKKEIFGQ